MNDKPKIVSLATGKAFDPQASVKDSTGERGDAKVCNFSVETLREALQNAEAGLFDNVVVIGLNPTRQMPEFWTGGFADPMKVLALIGYLQIVREHLLNVAQELDIDLANAQAPQVEEPEDAGA